MSTTKTINLRNLPEEVVRQAKACAALHGITLKDFVVKALAEAVQKDIPVMPATVGAFVGSVKPKKRSAKGR